MPIESRFAGTETKWSQAPTDANPGVAIGPHAVYRGVVTARAYPPFPNHTLPNITNGHWSPYRTNVYGYFQGRAAVMAVCDDPDHIPVDAGVEARLASNGTVSGSGWSMASSITRVWYSYWLGFPSLAADGELYDVGRLGYAPARGELRMMHGGASGPSYSAGSGYGDVAPGLACVSDAVSLGVRPGQYGLSWSQR